MGEDDTIRRPAEHEVSARKQRVVLVLAKDTGSTVGAPHQPVHLHLQVRNLLDRLYVLQGQGDEYFPAATRNAFVQVEIGL